MKKFKRVTILSVFALLLATAAGCSGDTPEKKQSAQAKTQAQTEEYSKASVEAVPYPMEVMKKGGWLERRNLRERLTRYADPAKVSYIYLFSQQGQLMAHYVVKGKVSNTASQMTTSEMKVGGVDCGQYCSEQFIQAPMDDGTWGPSEDAIFFFTPEGVMVQWNGPYLLADAPQNLTSQPLLVYNTSSKPTSVGDTSVYGG